MAEGTLLLVIGAVVGAILATYGDRIRAWLIKVMGW